MKRVCWIALGVVAGIIALSIASGNLVIMVQAAWKVGGP